MRVGPIIFGIIVGALGLTCLIWPAKIQQYALKSPSVGKFNPFLEWMKTRSYRVSLRFCGIMALSMAALVFWTAFSH